ncbi:MarR family transcriptional regulator [Seongchinamella unica]|uniref:MarR family transcriptional regulator n=1 Tax=Seongchinamella unica TaxID=2547392 RepID=A0A4R5LMX0_9GAMM|nr:MarR family transcriptional regulator [Seongchinamella unica]TDG11410.1 MarR family transcriptional regulator [Seongchinamella unica]
MDSKDHTATLSFELHSSGRLLRRNFDRRARDHGLSRSRWQVLWHLARDEGIKQAELADRLDVAPISLTRQLDNLEQEGLVARRRDEQDRRCFRVYLTEAAQPALAILRELAQEVREQAFDGLSEQEVMQLQQLLTRVRQNLGSEEK